MPTDRKTCTFTERLREPSSPESGKGWGFLLVPEEVSQSLARRGRMSANLNLDGIKFQAMLEPDGKLGHWVRVDAAIIKQAKLRFGDQVSVSLSLPKKEPAPAVPADFAQMLASHPAALRTWNSTTAIAQVDWIHWAESAKQAKTRSKRIADAAEMLSQGKKRVCCFDPSGYYSKALSAPAEASD
jgi:hypothetical protein